DETVFVQIIDSDSGIEKDFIVAQINRYKPLNNNRPSISFSSLETRDFYLYNGSTIPYKGLPKEDENQTSDLKSWGRCMKHAIDKLYDDWEAAPIATFGCWVTGPLCAIGGGLACAIKEI